MIFELRRTVVKETVLQQSLGEEWYNVLRDEFYQDYMHKLKSFLQEQKQKGKTIYPVGDNVFTAYRLTPLSKVRICIIGQDPYINPGEAHGLAFSTENGAYTPTLRQLEAAIRRDSNVPADYKWNNNLTRWAEQGVMLINSSLTVNAGESNSHKGKGWERFVTKTIDIITEQQPDSIFLLWGKDAQNTGAMIPSERVIVAEHPVAASYQNRVWRNNNCFNLANERIKGPKINW